MPALYARSRARNMDGGPAGFRVGRPAADHQSNGIDDHQCLLKVGRFGSKERRLRGHRKVIEARRRRGASAFYSPSIPYTVDQRRRYPPQPPQQEVVIENRRGQRTWRDDDDIWTRISRDRTDTEVVATRLRPGRSYDVRIRSCPLLGPPDDWSHAACGVVATAPVRPEAPPAPLPPTNADALLMVLAKGLGKNTQRRNLTSMRMGTDRRPSGDSDTLGEMAARRRPGRRHLTDDDRSTRTRTTMRMENPKAARRSHRRRPAAGRRFRRGRVSRLVSLCTAAVEGYERFPVDKWEVEVKSEEVEVRHSCSTDGDKGVATVFWYPPTYEIRSRCRNSAGWSRWSHH